MFGHYLQVLLDQAVLHPVLADAARLPIGNQFVGIEGDLEVEVIIDHYLEGLALDAVATVFTNRLGVDPAGGAIAVGVDAAAGGQLIQELRGQLLVKRLRHVAQGVFQGHPGLIRSQVKAPVRGAPHPGYEFGHVGQGIIQLDDHRLGYLQIF